jgi:tRNA ligase
MQDYTVDLKHDLSFGGKKAARKTTPIMAKDSPTQLVKRLEYFSISLPSSAINSLLSSLFPASSTSPEKSRLYNQLRNSRRIQPAFHVTLIHKALSKERADVWTRYTELYQDALTNKQPNDSASQTPPLGTVRVRLERLVWDNRVMAFVARIQPLDENADWPCVNSVPHITVGTASQDIKPKESNDLLQRWLEKGASPETGIWEAEVPSVTVLEGKVMPVLSRR